MAAQPTAITAIEPHKGQRNIWSDTTRHRIVRCGRRFGKSTLGIIETIGDLARPGVASRNNYHVGWFTPEYKYLDVVWETLTRTLAPAIKRVNNAKFRMELVNGSTVEAWTLNNNLDAGRSRKYHKIIVDEAGLIPNLRRWWDASASATLIDFGGRALFLGTPNPIGPDFDSFFDAAADDPDWAGITATTFDNNFLPEQELERIRDRRSKMPDWLWLQEYMAEPCDAAAGFFPRALVSRLMAQTIAPIYEGDLDLPDVSASFKDHLLISRDVKLAEWKQQDGRGKWKLWFHPDDVDVVRQFTYVAGCDIGAGVGSSNTVFSVFSPDQGAKIAEYSSPLVGPEVAAREMAVFGLWLRGATGAVRVCPETNGGAGQAFVKAMMDIQYPALFTTRIGGAKKDAAITKTSLEVGWRSSQPGKIAMLTAYQTALSNGSFYNPSAAALTECMTYAFDKRGSLVSIKRDMDPTDDIARVPHGDKVIADGLAWHAAAHAPEPPEPPKPEHDPTTFAYRKAQRQAAQARQGRGCYGYV